MKGQLIVLKKVVKLFIVRDKNIRICDIDNTFLSRFQVRRK